MQAVIGLWEGEDEEEKRLNGESVGSVACYDGNNSHGQWEITFLVGKMPAVPE